MRLSTRVRSWTLAAVAAAALPACRAPSRGVEDEPTTPAGDRPAGAIELARDPAASREVVPAEPIEPPSAAGEPTEAGVAPEPTPAAGEPSDTEVAPEPAAEPERASKTCRRPSPHYTGPLRDLVGLDEAAVRRCLGDPERTSGSTWHYRWPPGCAYEVSRVVVRFARGKVASAHAKHEITGQHCGADF